MQWLPIGGGGLAALLGFVLGVIWERRRCRARTLRVDLFIHEGEDDAPAG